MKIDLYYPGADSDLEPERVLYSLARHAYLAKIATLAVLPTDRLAYADDKLWSSEREFFLPHGIAGSPDSDLHPILLTSADEWSDTNKRRDLLAGRGLLVLCDPDGAIDVEPKLQPIKIVVGRGDRKLDEARRLLHSFGDDDRPSVYVADGAGTWRQRESL